MYGTLTKKYDLVQLCFCGRRLNFRQKFLDFSHFPARQHHSKAHTHHTRVTVSVGWTPLVSGHVSANLQIFTTSLNQKKNSDLKVKKNNSNKYGENFKSR